MSASRVVITATDGRTVIGGKDLVPSSPEIIGAALRETLKMIGMEYLWTTTEPDDSKPIPVGGRLTLSAPGFSVFIQRTL